MKQSIALLDGNLDEMQGELASMPLPADEFVAFVQGWDAERFRRSRRRRRGPRRLTLAS